MNLGNTLSVFVARRRWLKRLLINHLPQIAVYNLYGDTKFFFDPRDMTGPSFHFAYDLEKGFENYEEIGKEELLKSIPLNGNFYDIGANIGMFSLYFARKRPDITIHSFEPDSKAFTCLKSTFISDKFEKVNIYNTALGSESRTEKLYKSSQNDGGHSFLSQNGNSSEFEIVSVAKLDEFVKTNNIPLPDALKIDVEGFESEVLKGSNNTIKSSRPTMLIESNNEDLAKKGDLFRVLNEFKDLGIFAKEVGSDRKLSMEELSVLAQKSVERKNLVSNYFFYFS